MLIMQITHGYILHIDFQQQHFVVSALNFQVILMTFLQYFTYLVKKEANMSYGLEDFRSISSGINNKIKAKII